MPSPVVLLAAFLAVGFAVEATIGFGATLVTLALGSLIMPILAVLARVVPLNLALSVALVLRNPRAVDLRFLLARVLPAMAVGMPVGYVAVGALPPARLQLALAGFIFVLGVTELLALARGVDGADTPRPLGTVASLGLLFLGGVAHGALATGGPPIVYVCARSLRQKATLRATLSALWVVVNVALVSAYVARGQVTRATVVDSAPLVPGLVLGLALGDVVHARVPERAFRPVVFAALLVVAILLAARA